MRAGTGTVLTWVRVTRNAGSSVMASNAATTIERVLV